MVADLLIYNGACITFNEDDINWIAIKDDKIIKIGNKDSYETELTGYETSIDANGGSVLPGFYDSNVHLMQTALNKTYTCFRHAESFSDIENIIKNELRNNPGKPIIGYGLDETSLQEKKLPDRYILDKICSDVPIIISTFEYHTSILNTYGMLHYKISYTVEGVELDEKKMPTGILRYSANAKLREDLLTDIPVSVRRDAVNNTAREILKKGVTTIVAMEGGYTFSDWDAEFVYMYKESLPQDIVLFYQTTDVEMIQAKGLTRMGGSLFADGAFGSRNAALTEDYNDKPGWKGKLYYTDEEMDNLVLSCYENDIQFAVHTIGEQAIDQVLNAHKKAFEKTGKRNLRHRLEYAELVTNKHIKDIQNLGIVLSMQPAYEHLWGGPGKLYEKRIGDRYKRTNPFKEIVTQGITICGGSDSDVSPVDPILGIYSAVNHPVEKHRVDTITAIKMFTENGAYGVFEEDKKGIIKNDYLADIVILDKDILSLPKENIIDCKVEYTIKSGKVLYQNDR